MNSPAILKATSNKSEENLETPQLHKKPFKLRFGKQHDLGRSSISPSKPTGILPTLTSKFYSKQVEEFEKDKKNSIDRIQNHIDEMCNQGPSQRLKLPSLESHKYGWYHNVRLSDRSTYDDRFNFGIKSSMMVKYRVLVLATDRAMGNIKPIVVKAKA
ncbi:uncharacterized protein LOC143912151 [Arctopsyche grandis]|uniref:uncharacterized protein LOC143912151 n=1 Tax=Arctopsyche grandis TaxID=121162 RepID=UPI00406DA311